MNYAEILREALKRHEQGKATKIVHPFLPFPISVARDGHMKIGMFPVGMNISDFVTTSLWRVED